MIRLAGSYMIQEAVRTREAEARVKDRLSRGECIACPDGDIRQHVSRGQCVRCGNRFADKLEGLPTEAEKVEFESESYKQGLVLNPYEIGKLTKKNVFDEIADRVSKKKR